MDQSYNSGKGDYLELDKSLNTHWADKFKWCNNEINNQLDVFRNSLELAMERNGRRKRSLCNKIFLVILDNKTAAKIKGK